MTHPEQWQAYAAWQQARGQRWPLPAAHRDTPASAAAEPVPHATLIPQPRMDPMDELRRKISLCRACVNWSQRRETLWGEGSLEAPVMFIGDYPHLTDGGASNALFSPECFEMLRRISQALRLSPGQTFYTNMVMCPPPPGHGLTMEAVLSCREHFIGLLRLAKPRLIVTLGAETSASLSGQSTSFASMVGQWFSHPAFPQTRFMPVYHPRDMIAQPELKKATWQALQEAMTALAP